MKIPLFFFLLGCLAYNILQLLSDSLVRNLRPWIEFSYSDHTGKWLGWHMKKKNLISGFKKYGIWFIKVQKWSDLSHLCLQFKHRLWLCDSIRGTCPKLLHFKSIKKASSRFLLFVYAIGSIAISHSYAKIVSFSENIKSDCGGWVFQ